MTVKRVRARDRVNSQELERQYNQLLKGQPIVAYDEYINLEQPYFGHIVQTVTTYSVCEKPKLITE